MAAGTLTVITPLSCLLKPVLEKGLAHLLDSIHIHFKWCSYFFLDREFLIGVNDFISLYEM